MAANSSNNNSSNWVTARHGGDGKGTMVRKPATVNHTGAVNGKKPPSKGNAMTAPHPGDTQQAQDADAAEEKGESAQQESSEQNEHGVPVYISSMAAKLRAQHGLTHNHSLRIAAGITKHHAAGTAQVDDATKSAAATAHAQWTGLMTGGKGKAAGK